MGSLWVPCIIVALLLCKDATAQYDNIGIQELSKNIWPGGAGDSINGPIDALDAMLVVLNSRKLHRRQAPSTCPYCPTGYPCSQGCPTVPPLTPPYCGIQCSPMVAGLPGAPGPPGAPGFPIYYPGTSGCPGRPGLPGLCIRGAQGSPGRNGQDGTCPTFGPALPPNIDLRALKQLILQHFNCGSVTRCRYSIDDLLLRLHRLESRLNRMDTLKQKIATVEQTMARLMEAYIAKRVPGARGSPGSRGSMGIKGTPGYEGLHGTCSSKPGTPLPRGLPGVPGPKGEPGHRGAKICDCDGILGDPGVVGPSLVGLVGPKGYKGTKGSMGASGHGGPHFPHRPQPYAGR